MLRLLPTDISLPGTLRTYARLKSAYLDETEVGLDLRGGCELGFIVDLMLDPRLRT